MMLINVKYLTLQKIKRGMKDILRTASRRVIIEPAFDAFGHITNPAMILPIRSHKLNRRKQPTGTK